ncbi:unnamed protein product [Caenorhabditis auriculariae]|uniref:Uncharacterized protein n=1 Tax=Caenorhabditis auriculariae TaxID=2777116 RepID=A0A8S1GQ25_9PELO|nr:unnamed protein product [Caenorhabditis auriculariae]
MQIVYIFLGFILLTFCEAMNDDDRMVGWNKGHGLWGKRSLSSEDEQVFGTQQKRPVQNFNKLNGLWGKRSDPYFEVSDFQKRAAQWQMANGLWGR